MKTVLVMPLMLLSLVFFALPAERTSSTLPRRFIGTPSPQTASGMLPAS